MAKDFHAAFGNMNAAVRPGVGKQQEVVVEKKITAAQRRAQLQGVQTFLTDEEHEKLMIAEMRSKKKFEDILHEALMEYLRKY